MMNSGVARFCAASLLAVSLATPQWLGAWGNEGHTWINTVAVQKLPADVPAFLRDAAARVGYLGPEPDRWRNPVSEPQLKFAQEPDHFINLERVPQWSEWPRDRYAFIHAMEARRNEVMARMRAHCASSCDEAALAARANVYYAENVGLQPYAALEVFDRLKVAFREYRHAIAKKRDATQPEQDAIFYAGWLGHYVGDAAQPLHDSVNYDGWVGDDPNGYSRHRDSPDIHWDFESRFVAENLKPEDFAHLVHAPRHLEDPFNDYIAYIKRGNAKVERFYQFEKSGAFAGKGTAESRQFTAECLGSGAQMLADMIYTAWLDSATDPPDPYAAPAKTNP